ncbi:MAG: extracellular solute-binding protein, partial [Anaerolineae bacterium]
AATASPTAAATATRRASPTPAPTQLIVWEGLPPAQSEALAEDIESFTTAHPQVMIDLQHYNAPAEFIAAVQGGRAEFDLVLGPQALVAGLQAGGYLVPLEEIVAPDFLEGFIQPARSGAQMNDRQWGLPATAGFHLLLFYNTDLVEEPPATTSELFDLAEARTGEGQWGLAINSYDPLWLLPWLGAYGGWLTDGADTPNLDSQAMEQALTLWLKWQGRIAGIAPVITYTEARDLFLDGHVAMLVDGEWAIGDFRQADRVPWAVAPLPDVGSTGQAATPLILARYWAVGGEAGGDAPASTSQQQAIAAFLEFVTEPQRQLRWTSQFGLLPTRSEALNSPQILNDPILRVSARQLQAGRGLPLNLNPDTLLQAMRAPLREMLDGRLTPQEAAAAMQSAVE